MAKCEAPESPGIFYENTASLYEGTAVGCFRESGNVKP
jgi:hypothetical protein